MADLSTKYLGLELKNPIIVSSSTLVQNIEGIKDSEKGGAGAVVLRSLFEELIRDETKSQTKELWSAHPEEYDYVMSELEMQYGPHNYLDLIRKAKSEVKIPIIASINCHTHKWWIDYAKQIEAAGADALELNMSMMPMYVDKNSLDIEQDFVQIVKEARKAVNIPIAAKVGPYFTAMSTFANQLCGAGADALVLFNRFYQFDIDLDKMEIVGSNWYSTPKEMNLSLRWIAILYKHINGQLAATTGIHSAKDVIKQLLAGAQVVEIASAIYLSGYSLIDEMVKAIENWMNKNGHDNLDDFRGRLSLSNKKDPEMYERLQYIKALAGISK